MPEPIHRTPLAISKGNETLFVSLGDNTVRGFIWELDGLREVTSLQIAGDPWRLLWWPEQSILLLSVTPPNTMHDALEVFKYRIERAELERAPGLLSSNEGLYIKDMIQIGPNKFALYEYTKQEFIEFEIQ